MNKANKRRNLDEIQLARAFAIFTVLIVHSTSSGITTIPTDSILFPIYNFLNIAGKLGTPTFIMLSAFVLFYNYYPRETNWSLMKRFYVKRIKYILVPYILFSAIYFVVKWYLYYDYPSWGFVADKFLTQLSIGKAHPHLYFVFISVQFYLLFPLLLKMFKKLGFLRKNAIWIGLLVQWVWVYLNKNYFGIEIKGSISLSYFSFYFVGAFLGIYYNEIREKMREPNYRFKRLIPIFMGYGILVILYTGYMYLARTNGLGIIYETLPNIVISYLAEFTWATHALFAGLVIFYFAHVAEKKFKARTKMLFMEIGATSFGVYLIHPLILIYFRRFLDTGSPLVYNGWQVFTFVMITLLSWLAVRFVYYFIPSYWIIFGKLDPQQFKPLTKYIRDKK
ncbi:acyltransferase [Filobacillus milosensis]|nr:acyltransferase [Filobacillus milosensis]